MLQMWSVVSDTGFQCWRHTERLMQPSESPTLFSKVPSDGAIYLEEFDRSAGNLDERDNHTRTGTVRRNDDFLPVYGLLQVVHLEGHMRDGLDEVSDGRTFPVPHPLDAEGIALMITHRDSQVEKIDFPFKASRCGDANVIELHSAVSI